MRRLSEIEFDIDTVQREMARIVIRQSDDDETLRRFDYRLAALEKERLSMLSGEK